MKIGKILNIPIYLKIEVILFALLLGVMDSLSNALLYLALIVCILAHEFGHVLAGKHFNYSTNKIELGMLGGAAQMDLSEVSSRSEILIAIAGPIVSAAIGLLFFSVGLLAPINFITGLARANFILALFNLLPIFPMDGGRIFRATLRKWFTLEKATKIAMIVACVLALIGLISAIYFAQYFIAIVMLFVISMSINEYKMIVRSNRSQSTEWSLD